MEKVDSYSRGHAAHAIGQHELHNAAFPAIERKRFVYARRIFAEVRTLDFRTRIKWRVFERPNEAPRSMRIDPHGTRQTPIGAVERPFDERLDGLRFAIGEKPVLDDLPRTIPTKCIIRDDHSFFGRRAAPIPARETIFDRFTACIGIDVGQALPLNLARFVDFDFRAGNRGNGTPTMAPVTIQDKWFVFFQGLGMNTHDAGDTSGQRRCFFFETHRQNIVFPFHRTLADDERGSISTNIASTVFGKRPSIFLGAVNSDVHRTKVERVGWTFLPRFGIKG